MYCQASLHFSEGERERGREGTDLADMNVRSGAYHAYHEVRSRVRVGVGEPGFEGEVLLSLFVRCHD